MDSRLKGATIRRAMTLAVLTALLLIAASPALAQTEEVLYAFKGHPDGANPYATLTLQGGNIFGTTYNGGLNGLGSVFELTPNGNGGWNETVLYSFCPVYPSCTDGENPTYTKVIFDAAGNMYGTAFAGGTLGNGVVYELSPSSSGWTYQVIYNFAGQPDAANPINGLVMDAAGNLYGTSYNGGGGNNGAVFQLHPTGTGTWTEQVIAPVPEIFAGLAIDSAGDLYGTTTSSVFKIIPNGTNNWFLTNILVFTNGATQGNEPNGTPILDSSGNVYGTTTLGGKNNQGVIYILVKNSTTKYTERVLYNFGPNGTQPIGGLVMDSSRNLYGTTTAGGIKGDGVVYKVTYSGGKYVGETSLHAFNPTGEGTVDGAVPYGALILDSQNYLYGTTFGAGANGFGTVFVANGHASITKTTVTSSVNPSVVGEAVTFTATVTPAPPDGEVVVFQPIGQSTLKGGVATYTTSALPQGTTVIHALYNGDLNFTVSKSAPLNQVVQ